MAEEPSDWGEDSDNSGVNEPPDFDDYSADSNP